MKKIFLWLSLSSLAFVPTIGTVLSSCAKQSNLVEMKTINFDLNNFSSSLGISSYSCDDIIALLKRKDFENKDFVEFISLLGDEISQKITNIELLSFFNFENSNTDPSENLSSQSKVNLNFLFSYDGTTYNVFIKNIYLFSNSVFLPSYLTIDNSGKYTSFDQDDLGWASNFLYSEITGTQWRTQINDYFLQQNPNAKNLIIPNFGYIFDKGLLNDQGNIYQLTYIIDPIYKEQISKLPNAVQFTDISLNIKISPYAGKELKNEFILYQNDINTFFNNATFEEISNMKDTQIYDYCEKYVRSLEKIQPLRDCLSINSSTNIKSINNYNLNINQYSNPKTIVVSFSSVTLPSYNYKFILNFGSQ